MGSIASPKTFLGKFLKRCLLGIGSKRHGMLDGRERQASPTARQSARKTQFPSASRAESDRPRPRDESTRRAVLALIRQAILGQMKLAALRADPQGVVIPRHPLTRQCSS